MKSTLNLFSRWAFIVWLIGSSIVLGLICLATWPFAAVNHWASGKLFAP